MSAEDALGLKPGLLQRMFLGLEKRPAEKLAFAQEGGATATASATANATTIAGASTLASASVTSASSATTSPFLTGGAGLPKTYINYKNFKSIFMAFFSRSFLLVFIFVLSIHLTYAVVTPGDWLVKAFVGKDSVDESTYARTLQEKKGKIFLFVLVVLLFFLLMHAVLLLVAYGICYIVATEKSPSQMEVPAVANEIFMNMFWIMRWSGSTLPMTGYLGSFLLATAVLFIVFVVYFFFAKSYFQRLTYSSVLTEQDREKGKLDVHPLNRFILHYGHVMLVVLIFGLGIANINYSNKSYKFKIYEPFSIFVLLFVILLMSFKMMTASLRKNIGSMMIHLVVLVIVCFGYAYAVGLFG